VRPVHGPANCEGSANPAVPEFSWGAGSLVTYVPLIRLSPKVSNAIEQAVKAGCCAAVNQKRAAQRPLR
jgi:hypothetical protein